VIGDDLGGVDGDGDVPWFRGERFVHNSPEDRTARPTMTQINYAPNAYYLFGWVEIRQRMRVVRVVLSLNDSATLLLRPARATLLF
jgi:hypothetical protein